MAGECQLERAVEGDPAHQVMGTIAMSFQDFQVVRLGLQQQQAADIDRTEHQGAATIYFEAVGRTDAK